MRFKPLSASVLAVAVVVSSSSFLLPGSRAQEKPKAKAKAPEVRVVPDTPDVWIGPPEWSVVTPMPAIAPMPDINIEIPDIYVSVGDGFFYEDDSERTEREELRQTYQLSQGARVELSNINGSIDV